MISKNEFNSCVRDSEKLYTECSSQFTTTSSLEDLYHYLQINRELINEMGANLVKIRESYPGPEKPSCERNSTGIPLVDLILDEIGYVKESNEALRDILSSIRL